MGRRIKQFLRGGKGRFTKSTVIVPITRKEQQHLQKEVRVRRLENKSYPFTSVSSSNLKDIAYMKITEAYGTVMVGFLTGRTAAYWEVPFYVFEEFYYAHSKGTFFYKFIRNGGYRWNYV